MDKDRSAVGFVTSETMRPLTTLLNKRLHLAVLVMVSLGVLHVMVPACHSAEVQAVIDAQKTASPISPYLYGMFIEHAGNLMYRGMWAEMLGDRKFYYAVSDQETVPPVRSAGGMGRDDNRRWNSVGPLEFVTMDARYAYAGDHSPSVKLSPSQPRGIRQGGLTLKRDTAYTGRIICAGGPDVKVSVSLIWGQGDTDRQTVDINQPTGAYAAFPLSFKSPVEAVDARIEITATGSGVLHIGAVSLMPADHIHGWRPEVVAAFKSLRSGVWRFPGGNFVSAHEWRHAIGDPDRRPPTWDPVRRSVQSNDIGTDEFLLLCKLLDVEPYITVNAGTGDAWSAAQYVEYTNGAVSTPMGKQRADNGHPEPYGVRFWGIGNEMWGLTYQFGAMTLRQFEFKHNEFAKAMRKVDSTIVLLASGAMPDTMTGARQSLRLAVDNAVEDALSRNSTAVLNQSWESFSGSTWDSFFRSKLVPPYLSPQDWTGGLLSNCFDNLDMISEHFYNYGGTHFSLAEGRQVPNDADEPVTDWMRRSANHIRIKCEAYREYEKLLPQLAAHPKPMAISEWAYTGGQYPVFPALAWTFHEMFRHTDIIKMANFTFATSLLNRDGASLNTNGLLFKFYRDHFGSIPVAVSGNSPQPKPTEPAGGEQPAINAGSDTFPLDVVAAWTADRRTLTVAVINPTQSSQRLNLRIAGVELAGRGKLHRMVQGGTAGVTIDEQSLDAVPMTPVFAPFSVSVFSFPAK